ncbi:peptidoglycan-binding domain-containing protein [Azospirillum sp. ST 5-10]|uniref:peptidoglycan-binding domain-containing protein n=1 Tax=unclassified Azospirillum TaxID=2630922 RepID=UPI003F49DB7D
MIRASALALALLASTAGLAGAQTYGNGGRYTDGAAAVAPGYSVTALQRALQRAGYDIGQPDGAMGARTRAAITAYQRDNGLPVTGEPSPQLYARLTGGMAPSAGATGGYGQPVPSGSALGGDDLVADVQLALRQRGYGVREVTGSLDAETRAAIRAYQRDAGLAVTGEPDRRLLAALEGGDARRGTAGRDGQGDGRRRDDFAFEIEQRLQDKGFTVGPVDGEIDAQTTAAIRQYQELRGFTATGEPSRQLLADLRASNATAGPTTPEGLAGSLLRGFGRQFQQPGQ